MPKPAYPISGDPISSAWGASLVDYIGEHMRYVRNPQAGIWSLDDIVGTGAGNYVLYELLQVPANDPNIIAVDVACMFRIDSGGGAGQAARLFDYSAIAPTTDANEKVRQYWTGANQRGGMSGSVFLRVGGVNNRQIYHRVDNAAGSSFWLMVYGWWMAERMVA